jgi:ribulose-phosphate 3-epimerase
MEISASLWSADMANFADEIRRVEPYVERYHFDVGDGAFIPTLLFFPDLVKALRHLTKKDFDVHLMVQDPAQLIGDFASSGADKIILHVDHVRKEPSLFNAIKSSGMKAGIALTSTEEFEIAIPYLDKIDSLLIMGTQLGIKGVDISEDIYHKIKIAKQALDEKYSNITIEVDGGIRRHTVPLLKQAGADAVVAGSLLFKQDEKQIHNWIKHQLPGN